MSELTYTINDLVGTPELIGNMSSEDLVMLLTNDFRFDDLKIAALPNLQDFTDVRHVIYFVREKMLDRNGAQIGLSICMIVGNDGYITLEMNTALDRFWNYWEWTQQQNNATILDVFYEIHSFMLNEAPRKNSVKFFRDGSKNVRPHRIMHSEQKVSHLNILFGYKISATDF